MKNLRHLYPKNCYPLSDQLIDFIEKNKINNHLKLNNPYRFILLPLIGVIYLPQNHKLHGDEVLGLFYFDKDNYKKKKTPYFKQDYIVNKNTQHKEFFFYVAKDFYCKSNNKNIKLIDLFFNEYGESGKFFHRKGKKPWEHHYNDANDLPDYPNLKCIAQLIKQSTK